MPMRSRRPFVIAFITAAALTPFAAGCAAGGSQPSADTTTPAGTVAFTRCMRAHGVRDFPDPPPIGAKAPKPSPKRLGVSESELAAAINSCDQMGAKRSGRAGVAPAHASGNCASLGTCYSPRQLETAYGLLPLLKRGIDGRGVTVVLPELAEPQFPLPSSDLRKDLAQFDRLFHLPRTHLRVVGTLAPSASPWLANGEEVLDTEMVHAIAPRAAIVEVLVKGTSLNTIGNAVSASVAALRLGTTLGSVISISAAGQTGGEHCDNHAQVATLHKALQEAAKHHVTVVAASGDIGAVGEPCQLIKGLVGGTFSPIKEANLPASDPLVLAVGGTTLAADPTGRYGHEIAWGLPFGDAGTHFQGSGGGLSHLFTRPGYQDHLPRIESHRGVPDVAATAAPDSLAVVTSNGHGNYTIEGHGGTSASAPLWAGLVALADETAHRPLGFVNAALYRIGRSAARRQAFHDVTTGANTARFPPRAITGYSATPGWDAATGWGSPNAGVLVPLLARNVRRDDGRGQ